MSSGGYHLGIPGFTAIRESIEADVLWGNVEKGMHLFDNDVIDSTAVDAGSSPTTILRPALLMAKLDNGNGWVDYDTDALDGSQQAQGILLEEVNMLDPVTAVGADRFSLILVGGPVKAANILNLDQKARAQLQGRFDFDDDMWANRGLLWRKVVAKTANYTVVVADNGILFTTAAAGGAVTFTLPTIAAGLTFFFAALESQDMIIASAEGDNMIVIDDELADSIAFSTANEQIGAIVGMTAIHDGTTLAWLPMNLSIGAHTVTPAS